VDAQKIILDCDPGVDDALAIVFAHGHPGLSLSGITTVAGNVGLELTTTNALRVAELLDLACPVVAGCGGPLLAGPLRAILDARHAHGDDGLAGARLPAPAAKPRDGHAVDFILAATAAAPGEITLVATGPLTNIALAVRRDPALVSRVRDFVIMGGSATRGNVTPAAEFNIGADPEAAAIVFDAGWRVTMVGLDVTLRARARPAVLERMQGLGRLSDDLLVPCLARFSPDPAPLPGLAGQEGPAAGPAVHDVCALVRVVQPDVIGCAGARVGVETCGTLTTGMTVADFRALPEDHNALVATDIDIDRFWDVVIGAYGRAAAGVPARHPGVADRSGM
jgi:purine nucleosidase